jgi:pyruvate dehydrogenase kinase 2/3/4
MNKQYLKIFSYKNSKISKLSLAFFLKKPNNQIDNIKIAQEIKSQIKTRIAHRIINLSNFPICLREFSQIKYVKDLYFDSFNKIDKIDTFNNINDCKSFNLLLNDIKQNHNDIPVEISKAVQDYKNFPYFDHSLLNNKLNEFYHARIGIRLLIDYYNFIFTDIIDDYLICNYDDIIDSAFSNAKSLCTHVYNNHIPNPDINNEVDSKLLYIPSHLYFISFEILKNAIRSSVESNQEKPIEIEIKENKNQIIFVFRDFGKSISHSEIKKIFNYTYTTVEDKDTRKKKFIAGYGHGLPLSRLYSRFFGGDLMFVPFQGIKSEVILYLNKNANSYEIEI